MQTIKSNVVENNKPIINIREVFNKMSATLNHKQIFDIESTNNEVLNFPIALNVKDNTVYFNEINQLNEMVKISLVHYLW